MQLIPVQPLPNQSFSTTLGSDLYDLKFITCVNITACTILRNKQLIVLNSRVVPNMPIIPYVSNLIEGAARIAIIRDIFI